MPSVFEELAARNQLSAPITNDKNPEPIQTQEQGSVFQQAAKPKPPLLEQFKKEFFSQEESPFEQGIGQTIRPASAAVGGAVQNFIELKDKAGDFIFDKLAPMVGLATSKELPQRSKIFPTSEDIEKSFDEYTEGRYQPKDEFEKRTQESIKDFFSLLVPVKGKIPFLRALGQTIAGQTGKEATKFFKGEEGTQDLVKTGSMILAGLYNHKAGEKFVANSFDKFRKSIPQSTPINTQNLDSQLDGFIKQLNKGLGKTVADKSKVLAPAEALKQKAQSNFMELDDLLEAKVDINRIMGEPETLKGAKKYLKSLAKIVDDAVEVIGNTNPESLKLYRDANSAYGALKQSEKAGKIIQKALAKHPLKSAGAAFALDQLAGIPLATIAKGTATGFAALKGFEILKRFATNKQFAGLYFNLIKEAAVENQAGVAKYLRQIDKEAKKEE